MSLIAVDASVSRAAGKAESVVEPSVACRDFLSAALESAFVEVIWNEALKAEWLEHASSFSNQWLIRMFGRKRVRIYVSDQLVSGLVKKMVGRAGGACGPVLSKDGHLLELAVGCGATICSLDENARTCVAQVPGKRGRERVGWINPSMEVDAGRAWLEEGAVAAQRAIL